MEAALFGVEADSGNTPPNPPPIKASRNDLRGGEKVSFDDTYLQPQVDTVVRINQRTATIVLSPRLLVWRAFFTRYREECRLWHAREWRRRETLALLQSHFRHLACRQRLVGHERQLVVHYASGIVRNAGGMQGVTLKNGWSLQRQCGVRCSYVRLDADNYFSG